MSKAHVAPIKPHRQTIPCLDRALSCCDIHQDKCPVAMGTSNMKNTSWPIVGLCQWIKVIPCFRLPIRFEKYGTTRALLCGIMCAQRPTLLIWLHVEQQPRNLQKDTGLLVPGWKKKHLLQKTITHGLTQYHQMIWKSRKRPCPLRQRSLST